MLYLIIPVIIFAVDQLLKRYVEANKEMDCREEICGGRLMLRRSHNRGAMLNFMERRPKLVAGVSLGFLIPIMISFLVLLTKNGKGLLKLGLSFLIGGACSNAYDRLVRKYVVDYFSFQVKWEKLRRIVFNIGDLFIFLGSLLVILWNGRQKS